MPADYINTPTECMECGQMTTIGNLSTRAAARHRQMALLDLLSSPSLTMQYDGRGASVAGKRGVALPISDPSVKEILESRGWAFTDEGIRYGDL